METKACSFALLLAAVWPIVPSPTIVYVRQKADRSQEVPLKNCAAQNIIWPYGLWWSWEGHRTPVSHSITGVTVSDTVVIITPLWWSGWACTCISISIYQYILECIRAGALGNKPNEALLWVHKNITDQVYIVIQSFWIIQILQSTLSKSIEQSCGLHMPSLWLQQIFACHHWQMQN